MSTLRSTVWLIVREVSSGNLDTEPPFDKHEAPIALAPQNSIGVGYETEWSGRNGQLLSA
jgi:hypothetical protein